MLCGYLLIRQKIHLIENYCQQKESVKVQSYVFFELFNELIKCSLLVMTVPHDKRLKG